jgi:hypothetical protein
VSKSDPTDIVIILSHELACALEMNFEPHEMTQLWPEALAGLGAAADYLKERGLPTPGVVENVLRRTERT